jgi:cardiolipin synthase
MANPPTTRTGKEVVSHVDDPLPPLWLKRSLSNRPRKNASDPSQGVFEGRFGESPLKQTLLDRIARAREVLLLSTFLIADPELEAALMNAAQHGVRIYLMTASENRLKSERREDSENEPDRFEEHSRFLRRLAGRVLVRTGEDLHAKFIVADPNSRSTVALLSTANFTTKALAENPELGISLEEDEARDLARLFQCGFWHQAKHELIEDGPLLDIKPLGGPPPLPKALPYTALGKTPLREALVSAFAKAEDEIWFTCYGFEPDHQCTLVLLEAIKRGVRAHIMTRPREKGNAAVKHTDALIALAKAGAEVRGHFDLHGKALVWTQKGEVHGLVMTSNMTTLGLDQGFEAAAILHGSRAVAVRELLQNWWESMPWEFRATAHVGQVTGSAKLWRSPFLEDAAVSEEAPEQHLGRIYAKTPEEMGKAKPSSFPPLKASGKNTFYHRIPYLWEVVLREEVKRKEPVTAPADSDTSKPAQATD